VEEYILGCTRCARFGVALRTQELSLVFIDAPNVLWGMDVIGPFLKANLSVEEVIAISWPQMRKYYDKGFKLKMKVPEHWENVSKKAGFMTFTHILLVVDYFTHFIWAFVCTTDSEEEVMRCLRWLFDLEGTPVGMYLDEGPHFSGKKTQRFLKEHDILWIPSPTGAKKATGMVEKSVDMLQRVLKKVSEGNGDWPIKVQSSAFESNRGENKGLGFTAFETKCGHQPTSYFERRFPDARRIQTQAYLQSVNVAEFPESDMLRRFMSS
jgi:hypothetical protein